MRSLSLRQTTTKTKCNNLKYRPFLMGLASRLALRDIFSFSFDWTLHTYWSCRDSHIRFIIRMLRPLHKKVSSINHTTRKTEKKMSKKRKSNGTCEARILWPCESTHCEHMRATQYSNWLFSTFSFSLPAFDILEIRFYFNLNCFEWWRWILIALQRISNFTRITHSTPTSDHIKFYIRWMWLVAHTHIRCWGISILFQLPTKRYHIFGESFLEIRNE